MEPQPYAWIIDIDHQAETEEDSDAGTMGPRSAPDEYLAILQAGERPSGPLTVHTFIMYDDDRNRCYTGRMICDASDGVAEEAAYGPLGDFGTPNVGATEIRYPHHKHLDCG